MAAAWLTPGGLRQLWPHAVGHCFQRLTSYPGAYGAPPIVHAYTLTQAFLALVRGRRGEAVVAG